MIYHEDNDGTYTHVILIVGGDLLAPEIVALKNAGVCRHRLGEIIRRECKKFNPIFRTWVPGTLALLDEGNIESALQDFCDSQSEVLISVQYNLPIEE